MELRSKTLHQKPLNTKPKTKEPMLVVMDKSTHEKYSSQPLQTIKNNCKIIVTFLTA